MKGEVVEEVKDSAVFSSRLVRGIGKAGGESFGGKVLSRSSVWYIEYELMACSPGKRCLDGLLAIQN